MRKIKLEEARMRLPELIEEAARGEEVVISQGDGAAVRLTPIIESKRRPRRPGTAKGLIHVPDDFDDPLEDFAPYM